MTIQLGNASSDMFGRIIAVEVSDSAFCATGYNGSPNSKKSTGSKIYPATLKNSLV
jgi:hypothetical protein